MKRSKSNKLPRSTPSPSTPPNNGSHRSSPTPTPPNTSNSEDDASLPGSFSKLRGTRKESEQKRRIMMNQYFDELIILLSMVSERNIPKKMDKVTTLREAVNCIRVYHNLTKPSQVKEESCSEQTDFPNGESPGFSPSFLENGEVFNFFLDSHDMFMLIITETGRILYSTELITSLLGHMQSRLVGQSIYDYIHEDDKSNLMQLFQPQEMEAGQKLPSSPITAYPSQKMQCHLKLYSGETCCFPQFLPFSCLTFLRKWEEDEYDSNQQPPSPESDVGSPSSTSQDPQSCLLILGKLPTALTMIDLPIGTNDVSFEFEMRVSREGTIIGIDKHAALVFGFLQTELIGSSFFEYIDPYHVLEVGEAMVGFLNTGLGSTAPYRMRTKGDRYLWLMSKGYLSYNPWNHKPDHILLTNRILGCDQVLPEHRFFRSRKLLPDTDGEECYVPPPLQPLTTCAPQDVHPTLPPAAIVTQASPAQQLLPAVSPSPRPITPPTSYPIAPPTSHPITPPTSHPIAPPTSRSSTPPTFHFIASPASSHSVSSCSPPHPNAPPPPLVSRVHPMVPTSPLQQHQQQQHQQQQHQHHQQQQQQQQHQHVVPRSLGSPVNMQPTGGSHCLDQIHLELERKSLEVLELQKQLLEQQHLMEKERHQFYHVTQQVMQCIGNSVGAMLPPNLQLACSTSSRMQQPPTPDVTTRSNLLKLPQQRNPLAIQSTHATPTPTPSTWTSKSHPTVYSAENFHSYQEPHLATPTSTQQAPSSQHSQSLYSMLHSMAPSQPSSSHLSSSSLSQSSFLSSSHPSIASTTAGNNLQMPLFRSPSSNPAALLGLAAASQQPPQSAPTPFSPFQHLYQQQAVSPCTTYSNSSTGPPAPVSSHSDPMLSSEDDFQNFMLSSKFTSPSSFLAAHSTS